MVHVPAIIHGVRRDATGYERVAWLPLTQLGLDRIMVQEHLMPAEQAISVKHFVLTKLPLLEHGAIHEESGEMWAYDPSRAWRISTMTTDPTEGGPVVTTALDRPLLAQPVDSMCIPPTAIPEAFSDYGGRYVCAKAVGGHPGRGLGGAIRFAERGAGEALR